MAAPSVVQSFSYLGGSPESTHSESFASTPATSSVIVLFVVGYWADNTDVTVTDNQSGNTYTKQAMQASSGFFASVFTCPVAGASGTFTVTADTTGGSNGATYFLMFGFELSGCDESALVNQTATDVSAGFETNPVIDMGSTTASDCWIAGAIIPEGSYSVNADSPWTPFPNDNVNELVAYRAVTSTGNYDPSWTLGGGDNWHGVAIAIKGTDPPPPVPTLSSPGVNSITATSAIPKVTITYP